MLAFLPFYKAEELKILTVTHWKSREFICAHLVEGTDSLPCIDILLENICTFSHWIHYNAHIVHMCTHTHIEMHTHPPFLPYDPYLFELILVLGSCFLVLLCFHLLMLCSYYMLIEITTIIPFIWHHGVRLYTWHPQTVVTAGSWDA